MMMRWITSNGEKKMDKEKLNIFVHTFLILFDTETIKISGEKRIKIKNVCVHFM